MHKTPVREFGHMAGRMPTMQRVHTAARLCLDLPPWFRNRGTHRRPMRGVNYSSPTREGGCQIWLKVRKNRKPATSPGKMWRDMGVCFKFRYVYEFGALYAQGSVGTPHRICCALSIVYSADPPPNLIIVCGVTSMGFMNERRFCLSAEAFHPSRVFILILPLGGHGTNKGTGLPPLTLGALI